MPSPGQTFFLFRRQQSPCLPGVPLSRLLSRAAQGHPLAFWGLHWAPLNQAECPSVDCRIFLFPRSATKPPLFSSSFLARRLPAQGHKAGQLPTMTGSKAPAGRRQEALPRAPSRLPERTKVPSAPL